MKDIEREDRQKNFEDKRNHLLNNLANQRLDIVLDRNTILQELLMAYKDNENICSSFVKFSFVNEEGVDFDGIKREVYSLFWCKALVKYFEGTATFVPLVGPQVSEAAVRSMGRMISHFYVLTSMFPIQINKAFMVAVIVGHQFLTENELIEAFMEYISKSESIKLTEALNVSKAQGTLSDELQLFLIDFFSEYGVREIPTVQNLESTIVAVAKSELIAKPAMAKESMKEGMFEGCFKELWSNCTKEDVFAIYSKMQLTTDRVVSLLEEPSFIQHDKAKLRVFAYLKKYIRCLSEKELATFLHFVTGSPIPVDNKIEVAFHCTTGTLPHIKVHTCGALIDLPSSGYQGFADFRSQMDCLLSNASSWKFSTL